MLNSDDIKNETKNTELEKQDWLWLATMNLSTQMLVEIYNNWLQEICRVWFDGIV